MAIVSVGEATTPLIPRQDSRKHRNKILSTSLVIGSLILIVVAVISLSSGRKAALLSESQYRAESQRLAEIDAENKRLRRETTRYTEKQRLEIVKKQQRQVEEKERELKARNLKLKLEKAEIQHQILSQRLQREKRQELLQKKAGKRYGAPIFGNRRSQLSVLPSMGQKEVKRATEQLVGEYVKTCTSWGCKIVYQPESDDMNMTWYAGHSKKISWAGKNGNTQIVTGNHLMWPLGPLMRENVTRYQAPLHDIIPKKSKLGDNWIGFGHPDSFVKVENSGIGPNGVLPPWKGGPMSNFNNYNNSYKPFGALSNFAPANADPSALQEVNATKWDCPSGVDCISGGSGVDGVYESSPLSPTFYDPNKVLMEQHGVAVDSWPWSRSDNHNWGRDGADHYDTQSGAKFFDYDKGERPEWDFNNHALRSLPEYQNPDGPANKQLMMGRYWNDTHEGLPTMDDDWVRNESIKLQLEPPHGETREDDHFADWEHSSDKNMKLLYGESRVFNGMVQNESSKELSVDPWSLGDVPLPIGEYSDVLGADSSLVRTGEPVSDLQHGWMGQNMVGARSANIQAAAPPQVPAKSIGPSAGRITLEKNGVNVGGQW